MKRLIVIGIPTWCEASVIRTHVESIDAMLDQCFPNDECILVNADNCSSDNTAGEFLKAQVSHSLVSLRTEPGIRGKGYNFQLLFSYALEHNADLLITLDADLEVVGKDWLSMLSKPVFEGKADFVIPVYSRYWYDGNLTNQIVSPLVLATTGVPIRQPIAGEFGFSPTALRQFMKEPWPRKALLFGPDIYCVLRSLKYELLIEQVPLSTGKIHSWRSDTKEELESEMKNKFNEIVGTLLEELASGNWKPVSVLPPYPVPPPLSRPAKQYNLQHIILAAQETYKKYSQTKEFCYLLNEKIYKPSTSLFIISDILWARILARSLQYARQTQLTPSFFDAFKALFFMRLATVLPNLTDETVETMVMSLAEMVYESLNS